jgi:hypothetical protein
MKTAINGDFTNTVKTMKSKKRLSALEIAKNLNGKSEFRDLLKILEPHEIPNGINL